MKKDRVFWIGYSDLMTNMFFVMLVLFILTERENKEQQERLIKEKKTNEVLINQLEEQKKGLIQEKERLEKLLNLEKQFKPLIKDSTFYYLPECKKFLVKDLMGIEIFEPLEYIIKPEYIQKTINVGFKLDSFLQLLHKQNPELSYLLVIEGNMANTYDKRISRDDNEGYLISYQRSLAVYTLWLKYGINFRKYNVEVMLCGSGFNGLCRDKVEENNKRFSIQIIPKVAK